MRKSVVGGNGSQCDMCSIALKPFEAFRFTGQVLIPGSKYPGVSSDTVLKTKNKFHLCEKCYGKIITLICD